MSEIIPITLVSDQGVLELKFSEPETIPITLVRVIEIGASNLAVVAHTGEYDDLLNKPIIPVVPDLAQVALSGDYADLINKPFIPVTASDIGAVPATPGSRLMTNAEGIKLGGIAPFASANSADSVLLNRNNHTGQQAITTVTGLQAALDSKVNTVVGKGLSTNDFTDAEKLKLENLFNTDLGPLTIRVDALEADKVDKVPGQGLSDTNFTQAEKDKLEGLYVPDLGPLNSAVASLQANKVDKIPGKELSDTNFTQIEKDKLASLFNYDDSVLTSAVASLESSKVDKVVGKQLSTNDYTDVEKTKLAGLENFDPTAIEASISALQTDKVDKVAGKGLSTNDYTNADVAKLAGIAAGATANLPDSSLLNRSNHTGTQAIATVVGLQTALDAKVDTVPGLGLSSNDFTSAEKAKLASLESSHFRGTFNSYAALVAGATSPMAGDYADVDEVGASALRYIWDATEVEWVTGSEEPTPLTAAQIKTLYESNPDTNAFTDTEKTKLAGLFNYDDSALVSSIADLEANKVDVEIGKGLSANDFTDALKAKLDGVATGATANATDAFLLDRTNHTGAQAISTVTGLQAAIDNLVVKVTGKQLSTEDYTTAEKAKLAGIAVNATANDTDANLKNRSNHTGTQAISTVSGLQTALDGKTSISDSTITTTTTYSSSKLETVFTAFSDELDGIVTTFTNSVNTLDADKVDKVTGFGLSSNDYTSTEKTKLAGIAAGATVNSTDAALRDRTTHTGTQAISTVSGLQAALDQKTTDLNTVVNNFTITATNLENNKVDKVAGKALSTNDYTTVEKNKLAAISMLHGRSTSAYSLTTTTLNNVTGTALTLEANSVYEVDLRAVFSTDNTGTGITLGFADMTGGAVPQLEAHIYTSNVAAGGPGAGVFAPIVETTNVSITRAASSIGVNLLAYVSGRIYTGGSAMTLTPQVAAAAAVGTVSIAIGGISCSAIKVA